LHNSSPDLPIEPHSQLDLNGPSIRYMLFVWGCKIISGAVSLGTYAILVGGCWLTVHELAGKSTSFRGNLAFESESIADALTALGSKFAHLGVFVGVCVAIVVSASLYATTRNWLSRKELEELRRFRKQVLIGRSSEAHPRPARAG
jgi:hypothetical protein